MKSFLEDFDFAGVKAAAPTVIASALLAGVLVLSVLKVAGGSATPRGASISVAVFDVVKFANAQRAVASQFIGKKADMAEAGTLLLSLSKKTTAAIEKVAGEGTLVLVKQGVVAGGQTDITDQVLQELGLPTDVPTADPLAYIEDVAPTMLMMPPRPKTSAPGPTAPSTSPQVLP